MAWSKVKFGSVKRYKIKLLEELNKLCVILESRTLSSSETILKLSSLNELDGIQNLEEIMWRQRGCSLWLKQEDNNSKFFHHVASTMYSFNFIDTFLY